MRTLEPIEVNPISVITSATVIIGTLALIIHSYVKKIKEICECLEHANDLMKQALDDAGEVIKKQDIEIRRLSGDEPDKSMNVTDSTLEAVNHEEIGDSDKEWHLYSIKRNDNAPELKLNDITELFVIAQSHSQAIDFAKNEKGFVYDDWWDVEEIPICYTKRGILFSTW